jgi:hypothetical protein
MTGWRMVALVGQRDPSADADDQIDRQVVERLQALRDTLTVAVFRQGPAVRTETEG